MTADGLYPPRAALRDNRTDRRISRLAETWERIPFHAPIAAGQRYTQHGTKTFGTYTTGGVTIAGLATAFNVVMAPWTDGAGTVYNFLWDGGTMLVTDWAGTEIANGTDLSAISAHPYIAVMGQEPATGEIRLSMSGRLTRIEFEVAESFAASATNYWTLTARVLRADPLSPQTVGELVDSYTTSNRSLVAREPVEVYDSGQGIEVKEDDRLILTAAATGNPGPLVGACAWARIVRKVT